MVDCSRRALLGSLLSCSAVGLAGCIDGSGQANGEPQTPTDTAEPPDQQGTARDEQADGTSQETETGEDDDSDPITVVDTAVVERGSGCGQRDETITQTEINGNIVTVNGTISVQNACHNPVIEAGVSGTTLSVTVGSEPNDESEVCTQCVGSLTYESTVELSRAGIERVDVTHDQYSGQNDGVGDPENPTVDNIETVETKCQTKDSTATARVEDGAVVVEGVLHAPDQCHEATVTGLTYDENTLELTIGVESTDEICTACTGEIHYEADIDLGGVSPDRLRVDHVSGESHQIDLT